MRRFEPKAGLIVFVLALALAICAVMATATVLVEVLDHESISEIPPNSSTVLTAIFGGMIGIVGGFVGYRQGQASAEVEEPPPDTLPGHGYPSPEYLDERRRPDQPSEST